MPLAPEDEIADVPVEDADVDPEVLSGALHDGLATLPLIEREVLTLFYLRELSLGEVLTSWASPSVPSNHGSFAPDTCCAANSKPEETSYEHEHDGA